MLVPFLTGLGSGRIYESNPGVGAGSSSGFAVSVTFMYSSPLEMSSGDLLSNYDTVTNRGWRLRYSLNGAGVITLSAEVGRSDGSVLTLSGNYPLFVDNTVELVLSAGSGTDAFAGFFANGIPVARTTLGAGLTFSPAAGSAFTIGASTGFRFLGAGFSNTIVSTLQTAASFLTTRRTTNRYAEMRLIYGVPLIRFDNAWDTRSLIDSGLAINTINQKPAAEGVWPPCPECGNESLFLVGTAPFFTTYPSLEWWAPPLPAV